MSRFLILLLLLSGCASEWPPGCERWCGVNLAPMSAYAFRGEAATAAAPWIDVSQVAGEVSVSAVRDKVQAVAACLEGALTFGPLPKSVLREGQCYWRDFVPVKLRCLGVLVTDRWIPSADGQWQLLEDLHAPEALCLAKGLPTGAPCLWRAAVQHGPGGRYIAVVGPDLRMLGDPLVRIMTGCSAVWSNPLLAHCASATL